MKWAEVTRIAEAPPGFDDDRTRGGERVLEAIQAAWIDEAR